MHKLQMHIIRLRLNRLQNRISAVFRILGPVSTSQVGITVSRTNRGDGEAFFAEGVGVVNC